MPITTMSDKMDVIGWQQADVLAAGNTLYPFLSIK